MIVSCPSCGDRAPPGARFCGRCGDDLRRSCTACGASYVEGQRFCARCGAALHPPSAPETRQADAEHKPVTVLFCDMVGSTGTAEVIGAEAMHGLMSRFSAIAAEELDFYGTRIHTFTGDGFMALVGVPATYEDHARRAVLAALALRRRISGELGVPGLDQPVEVRIGINTGSVVVGAVGDGTTDVTAIGDPVNVAARLQAIAEPGTILMSEATARHLTGYIRSEPAGEVAVRGRAAPVSIHRVLGLGPRRSPLEGLGSRPLGRFVGRRRQLETLQDLVGEAIGGRGQVIGVVAEPGMGKSRLAAELRRSLAGARLTVLEGRCLSYGASIPYVPLIDIIRGNCGIVDGDDPDTVAGKVRLGLAEVGLAEDLSVFILRMLGHAGTRDAHGMTPEAVRRGTFETLLAMCLNGSRRRPLLLIIEDLHWIDRVSEEFLEALAESVQAAPVAILATYRPGYRAPWMQASYASQLILPRLTKEESQAMVREVVAGRPLDDAIIDALVGRAEGNPFFLEELTRAALDETGAPGAIPATVHDVLLSRVDRLGDIPRRVLQTASVLGREFTPGLIEAVWRGPGELEAALEELRRLEFIQERDRDGERVYSFVHALTQDVAYGSLLERNRERLHEATGEAYEALFAGRLHEVHDRLAHHYARTGRADKAVEYLSLLADDAVGGYAHAEAAAALREALRHAERLPVDARDRMACELTIRLVRSLYFLGAFSESLDVLRAVLARADALVDPDLTGRLQMWLAHTQTHAGDHDGAAVAIARAVSESSRSGDLATYGVAHYVSAREGFWLGRFADGASHGRTAVATLERTDEWWWLGHAYAWTGLNLVNTGDFEGAIANARRMKDIGEVRNDPRLQSYAGWNIAWYEATRGNCAVAIREGTESLQRSPDPLNSSYSMGWLGFSHRENGDHEQAIHLLRDAIRLLTQYRYTRLVAWFTAWLAEAELWSGAPDAARRTADVALRLARDVAYPWAEAVAARAAARAALAHDDPGTASRRLRTASDAFAGMGCRFDLAVTYMCCAEASAAAGDAEAVARDLAAARTLLDELEAPVYLERIRAFAGTLG